MSEIACKNNYDSWRNPYVTNGLVAMWDGEWNARGGEHNPELAVLKNTINSGIELTLNGDENGVEVGDKYVHFNGDFYYTSDTSMGIKKDFTVEIVAKSDTVDKKAIIITNRKATTWTGRLFEILANKNLYGFIPQSGESDMQSKYPANVLQSMSISQSSNVCNCHSNGSLLRQIDISSIVDADFMNHITIGNWIGNLSYNFIGRVYCVRLYSRALSDAEIAKNFEIDKERFGI